MVKLKRKIERGKMDKHVYEKKELKKYIKKIRKQKK